MKCGKILSRITIALTLALLLTLLPAMPALAVADLRLLPNSGKIGDTIEAYGSGFGIGSPYDLYFSNEIALVGSKIDTDVINYEFLGRVSAGATGAFEGFYFLVPEKLREGPEVKKVRGGIHYVYATLRLDKVIQAKAEFTMASAAEITLSLTEATVGAEVKISGTGFVPGQSVTIRFDSTQVKTATPDSSGSFSDITFAAPEGPKGSHTVEASDVSNNSAEATLAIKQSITVSPASGAAGDNIAVSGTGFAATSQISITFDNTVVASTTTNSIGSFSEVTFATPAKGTGTYAIRAADASGNADSRDFTLASVAVNLDPAAGFSGNDVTISGSGFRGGQAITIAFNNAQVATATSDDNGRFSATFDVPVLAAGSYKVKASDGSNSAETDFSITTTVNISPATSAASPGNVGTKLTVNGGGFSAGGTITVRYDGSQVAGTTANADGAFSAIFDAPASAGGEHGIVVTDGVNTREFTFFMESTPPPPPKPLKPEMDTKADAGTQFDWEEVSDPSGVTYTLQVAITDDFSPDSIVLKKEGLTQSQYTLTARESLESSGKKDPYYWRVRAVDRTDNSSQWSGTGSFYVGFSLGLPAPVRNVLIGAGALALLVLAFWLGRKTAYY